MVLLIIILCSLIYNIKLVDHKSIYDINDKEFYLYVKDYDIKDEYIKLTLCNKECLVGNYYFKNIEEVKDIKYGIKLKVNGSLRISDINTVPKAFNYRKYLYNNGIFYIIKINDFSIVDSNVGIIDSIRNNLIDRINSFDNKGYIKAFILGDNDSIDENEYSKYQLIGVTHLFALSGMHIGVIVAILNRILKVLNQNMSIIIIDIILVLYGFILCFPASLKRTILFFIINNLFKMFNVRISSLKVLFLVIFILVLNDYKIIYDIGFIYSVCTVGGILLSSEYIKSDNKIIMSFKLSFVAFLFSLPISLYYFYSINIFSIIYNVFYIFLVSSIIYPLSIMVLIIPKLYFVYDVLITCLVYITDILSKVDIGIIYLDFNIIEVLLFYLFLILFIKYNKHVCLFCCLFIILIDLIIPYFNSNLYVYFFDVDQGDSSLIISPNREDVVMIDTGGIRGKNVSDNVISFLKSSGIKKIDILVITHGDYDHMGDVYNILSYFNVGKVIFNCGEFSELEEDLINFLDKSKIPYYSCINDLNVGDNKLYFLNNKDYGNENDNSNVIYMKFINYKFLFMGDAGMEVEEDLIKKYNIHDIDVLKVGHHGSKTSSSKEFINEITPKYSIISVGTNNRYGHPNDNVLDNLKDSKIFRTDQDGSVIYKIKKDKLNIYVSML